MYNTVFPDIDYWHNTIMTKEEFALNRMASCPHCKESRETRIIVDGLDPSYRIKPGISYLCPCGSKWGYKDKNLEMERIMMRYRYIFELMSIPGWHVLHP